MQSRCLGNERRTGKWGPSFGQGGQLALQGDHRKGGGTLSYITYTRNTRGEDPIDQTPREMTSGEEAETSMPFVGSMTPEEEAGVAQLADEVKEQVDVRGG